MVRTFASCTLAVLFVSPTLGEDKKADAFQGDWVIQSVTRDGVTDDGLKGGSRVQEGNKYTINPPVGSKAPKVAGTFIVDATKSPATIDMKPEGGKYKGKTLLGIAKVEGETLTIAFTEQEGKRPTGFESTPGSGVVVAVHKKAK